MFDRCEDTAGVLPRRRLRKVFATDVELCRTRSLSARDRRRLLASPDLAEGAPRSQAIARCSDVAGAAGKESCRLRAQITRLGRLLATPDHCRAVTGRNGSHGQAYQTARGVAGTI